MRRRVMRLGQRMAPPPVQLFDVLLGLVRGHVAIAAAQLGIADALGDQARSVEELADALSLDPGRLGRLLRAMETIPLVIRHGDAYRLAPAARPLRSDASPSLRDLARMLGTRPFVGAWGRLADSVRTGRSGFELEYGGAFFEALRADPALGEAFDAGMTSISQLDGPAIAAGYDFGGADVICDVAGGAGRLLSEILLRHPGPRGIVADVPATADAAAALLAARGLADRARFAPCNFFEAVPAGADLYVMKNILHDWSDADAGRILRTVRAAMSVGHRLLVVEMALVDDAALRDPAKLLDLQMMVMLGGRERTPASFDALFAEAGLRRRRVIALPGPASIVEAVAV